MGLLVLRLYLKGVGVASGGPLGRAGRHLLEHACHVAADERLHDFILSDLWAQLFFVGRLRARVIQGLVQHGLVRRSPANSAKALQPRLRGLSASEQSRHAKEAALLQRPSLLMPLLYALYVQLALAQGCVQSRKHRSVLAAAACLLSCCCSSSSS